MLVDDEAFSENNYLNIGIVSLHPESYLCICYSSIFPFGIKCVTLQNLINMCDDMYIAGKYQASDSMSALISDNYPLLQVMSRFGIPLGLADRTIGEVCAESGVDAATFLAVANLMLHQNNRAYKIELEGLSLGDLMKYIRNSHIFYINFRLPNIRQNLIEALGKSDMATLIIRYFDDYVDHIKEHLRYEEERLFPYINHLLSGVEDEFSIDIFSDKHDHIDEPLTEFKNVIIRYYSGESTYEIMSVIHDLLSCAADLLSHNLVEDRLLVPMIRKIEEAR